MAVRTAHLLMGQADPLVEVGSGASGLPLLGDRGEGPLAALADAAQRWAALPPSGHVIVLATDLPRLTAGLVGWLASHPSPDAVVPVDQGHPQPLCARYPVAALHRAANLVGSGERSLRRWLAAIDVHLAKPADWMVAAGDPLAMRDADTPEQLSRLAGRGSQP